MRAGIYASARVLANGRAAESVQTENVIAICTEDSSQSCFAACFLTISSYKLIPLGAFLHLADSMPIISTNTTKPRVYHSGNISLCLDGVPAMDSSLMQSYTTLSEIASLQKDWNGNGALGFSSELVDIVRQMVGKLCRQPRIFPTARESIQLEYENDAGDYLEFEIFENGQLKKFYFAQDGTHETKYISIEEVDEVVSKFYGF